MKKSTDTNYNYDCKELQKILNLKGHIIEVKAECKGSIFKNNVIITTRSEDN